MRVLYDAPVREEQVLSQSVLRSDLPRGKIPGFTLNSNSNPSEWKLKTAILVQVAAGVILPGGLVVG
jgi:hypothetical protein